MSFGNWLGLAGVVAVLLLLWSLRDALVLLFAAVVLAMALCTLVGTVQRRLGCRRQLALALSLLGVAVLLAIVAPYERRTELMALALLGLVAWTLLEYVLHRFVLHGMQPFQAWHAEHHRRPQALIGTPTVAAIA